MELGLFCFVFEEASSKPEDRSVSALNVVGMHAYIYDSIYSTVPIDFDALVNHDRTRSTIRALVLLFDSIDHLRNSVKPFAEVLALETETIELVLAYEDKEERRAVCVNPVTLEPNGASFVASSSVSRY